MTPDLDSTGTSIDAAYRRLAIAILCLDVVALESELQARHSHFVDTGQTFTSTSAAPETTSEYTLAA